MFQRPAMMPDGFEHNLTVSFQMRCRILQRIAVFPDGFERKCTGLVGLYGLYGLLLLH
jgi:hypothetical protein